MNPASFDKPNSLEEAFLKMQEAIISNDPQYFQYVFGENNGQTYFYLAKKDFKLFKEEIKEVLRQVDGKETIEGLLKWNFVKAMKFSMF